jgi:hypothetical protein
MDKITIIEQPQIDGSIVEVVIIDRGNDEFTSMDKSFYDAMQAEQSTPMIPGDE